MQRDSSPRACRRLGAKDGARLAAETIRQIAANPYLSPATEDAIAETALADMRSRSAYLRQCGASEDAATRYLLEAAATYAAKLRAARDNPHAQLPANSNAP